MRANVDSSRCTAGGFVDVVVDVVDGGCGHGGRVRVHTAAAQAIRTRGPMQTSVMCPRGGVVGGCVLVIRTDFLPLQYTG